MIFTSRTYRVAIRRSIQAEQQIQEAAERSMCSTHLAWLQDNLHTQKNHTRKLQARKRKERK